MTNPLPLEKQFPGFKTIIMGPSGAGKTFSLHTLAEVCQELDMSVRYLDLDRSLETLMSVWVDHGKPIPGSLAWHYMHRKAVGFDALIKMSDWVGKLDLKGLAQIKDMDRARDNQFTQVLTLLSGFPDQRSGKNLGAVDSWGNDCVFVLDALTSLSDVVFDMVTGTRPMRDKPDYGIAQNLLENLLHRLTMGCKCNFVLTAHVERLQDEVVGGVKLMPVTIGQAMKPRLPIPFSDVILAKRENDGWWWDTANNQADLKTRNLAYAGKLPPDFGPLVRTWDKRRQAFEQGAQA